MLHHNRIFLLSGFCLSAAALLAFGQPASTAGKASEVYVIKQKTMKNKLVTPTVKSKGRRKFFGAAAIFPVGQVVFAGLCHKSTELYP